MAAPIRFILVLFLLSGEIALLGASEEGAASGAEEGPAPDDYLLTLAGEKLPLEDTPLAATVLTGEELRAMGVTSLPEALRYLPGVDVFQLNGFTYAAGIRGVDDEFNPRFQVYLDGRLVNVAEFGGVDWESIPVSVEDIDRLEVIRATGLPGEAGSALEGQIRIWTRGPDQLSRLTYSGYGGTQATQIHFGRAAGSLGPFSGKASLEYRTDDGAPGANSAGLDDFERLLKFNLAGGWKVTEGGGLDLRVSGVQGKVGETSGFPISNGPTDTHNYSVAGSFHQALSSRARLSLGYYHEEFGLVVRDYPFAPLYGGRNIDLGRSTDALHASARVAVLPVWDLLATAGWKEDHLYFDRNSPRSDRQQLFHLHAGTELRPLDRLFLSAGLQAEHDLFAGWDLSPSAGVVYRLLPDHSLRFSYRVGSRKPTFAETRTGFVFPSPLPPPPVLPLITGNPGLESERETSYEVGYRGRVKEWRLLLDQQLFVRDLRDKVNLVPDTSSPLPGALTFDNAGRERSWGAETLAQWRFLGPFAAYATYTFQVVEDLELDERIRHHPEHKANAGLRFDLKEGWLQGVSGFLNLNYVSRIEEADGLGLKHRIDDRFRLDCRLAKRFWKDRVEVAIIGRNLLDPQTLEFRPPLGSNSDGSFGAPRMVLINLLINL
jgi:iron complex outermembrane receptor protein